MTKRGAPWARAYLVSCALAVAACTPAASESTLPAASASPDPSVPQSTAALVDIAPPDFYHPAADLVAAATPGQLLDSVEIKAPRGMRAWTVLYGSTGLDGQPVAVSGLVLVPAAPASGGGNPVVAWAHYTTGVADECAPSYEGLDGISPAILLLVEDGYVVTATDYEGLGTDGIHPYLIGTSEGRSVLDSIRAVQALPDAHASDEAVVIGHSQGGHAALWAAELAPTYAPDLDVLGAMAASPPADLLAGATLAFDKAADGDAGVGLVFGVWSEVYGLPLDFLTDEGQQSAVSSRDACFPPDVSANPYVSDPALMADWSQRYAENSPGAVPTGVPVLVIAADADESVAYEHQLSGVAAMCAIGDSIELQTVPGGHNESFFSDAAWTAIGAWISDRFAGVAPVSTC